MPDLLLKVEQARAQLGVSRGKLYQLIGSGELPSVVVGAGSRRVRQSDLDAYVARLGPAPESDERSIDERIDELVVSAPRMTPAQIARLRPLFNPPARVVEGGATG